MTKIYCADPTCEFCNEKGVCTQRTVCLSYHSVVTVWDGRQEYHRCKSYQKSKVAIRLENELKDLIGVRRDG